MAISGKIAIGGTAALGAGAYASFSYLRDGIDLTAKKLLGESAAKWVPSSVIAIGILAGGAVFLGGKLLKAAELSTIASAPSNLSGKKLVIQQTLEAVDSASVKDCAALYSGVAKVLRQKAQALGSTEKAVQSYFVESDIGTELVKALGLQPSLEG